MNKQEYSEYQERVATYLEGLECLSTGHCKGCEECERDIPDAPDDYQEEAWFSWSPCEVCGGIAGMRVTWHGVLNMGKPEAKILHGTCCVGCEYYLAYGRLDDTTMMEIEKS